MRAKPFPKTDGLSSNSPRGRPTARTRTIGKRRGQIPVGCRVKPGTNLPGIPVSKKFSDRKIVAPVAQTLLALGGAQDAPRLLLFHNEFCPQSDRSATDAGRAGDRKL